jgi:peptidoglycan/LPS O-acetylase OafA/YrhL
LLPFAERPRLAAEDPGRSIAAGEAIGTSATARQIDSGPRVVPEPSSRAHLPGIDGVRAVAAGAIVLFHVWAIGSPGGPVHLGPLSRTVFPKLPVGVTLFFVLSGFLLYRPYAASLLRGLPRPTLSTYLRNRALRILPAYWVILLATGLVLQTTILHPFPEFSTGSLLARPDALVMDLALVQNYRPSTLMTGIGPAWSLAIEVVFYLALPVLALLGAFVSRRTLDRAGRRWGAVAPVAALIALGISGKLAAVLLFPHADPAVAGWTADWHSVVERGFWTHADFFAFGMAVAVLRVEVEDGLVRLPRGWRWGGAAMAVLVVVAATVLTGSDAPHVFGSLMAVACALFLSLVVLEPVAGTRRPALVRLLETRLLAGLGLISYSLFLWHEPLVRWLHDLGITQPGRDGFVINLGIVGAAAIALSVVTYRLVEVPALRRKRGGTRRSGRDEGLPVWPG